MHWSPRGVHSGKLHGQCDGGLGCACSLGLHRPGPNVSVAHRGLRHAGKVHSFPNRQTSGGAESFERRGGGMSRDCNRNDERHGGDEKLLWWVLHDWHRRPFPVCLTKVASSTRGVLAAQRRTRWSRDGRDRKKTSTFLLGVLVGLPTTSNCLRIRLTRTNHCSLTCAPHLAMLPLRLRGW